MFPMESLLRASLCSALYYHPNNKLMPEGQQLKDLIPKILKGEKLGSIDSWVGDIFASVYHNILRLPPDEYDHWKMRLFLQPNITS